MGHCRLCHGKFSSRSLRSISGRAPGESSERPPPGDRVFVRDFQRLLGVAVHQDPALSQFVCKNCHAQFYQCHGLLTSFLQRVNVPPTGRRKPCAKTLSSEYCGIVRAVWGCDRGHDYTMDADSSCGALLLDGALGVRRTWDKDSAPGLPRHRGSSPSGAMATRWGLGRAPRLSQASPTAGPQLGEKQVPSPTSDDRVKDEFSDLSEGDFLSEDENDKKQNTQSSDESFEPYPEKKVSGKKSESKEAKKSEEPKIRKKPGPKPGWKGKPRCEREELPTIYKCPHQGCTAVYRGADGMKKHIKEHHEEVRERPCPHPGCNKVFMIDRYLQRHVKLIHTEVRNYICDECEVCGFQCRQRASLKYHMTKHKAETELDFACDQCGRRFEKAHNLNVHMSMVHPLTQTPDKAPEPPPGPVFSTLTVNSDGDLKTDSKTPQDLGTDVQGLQGANGLLPTEEEGEGP
ncbi:hypothetical protein E2I00_013562 [Balaenoptera physalus]|uniref:C2H2-type domain-containing protein n=1 Tax=Balaenoptera physalus TaxID=9770 RepID=A0A6A1QB48_BALPH|nr:hypothetical protein E2I00_013562 [Balaenoptera physalus]